LFSINRALRLARILRREAQYEDVVLRNVRIGGWAFIHEVISGPDSGNFLAVRVDRMGRGHGPWFPGRGVGNPGPGVRKPRTLRRKPRAAAGKPGGTPRAVPWADLLWPFRPGNTMRNIENGVLRGCTIRGENCHSTKRGKIEKSIALVPFGTISAKSRQNAEINGALSVAIVGRLETGWRPVEQRNLGMRSRWRVGFA
jgi:hypothetical protein